MSDWKGVERAIAKIIGGERVPVTGRQRGSAPDIAHQWLSVEVKNRRKLPAWMHDAMAQAEASNRGDQLPIVFFHQNGMKYEDSFCLIRLKDFVDWFGGENESS